MHNTRTCIQVWESWTPEMEQAQEEEEQGPAAANPSAPKEVLQVCGCGSA